VGCEQITPGMVGLAKKLEGKPFHLIASHCQRGDKDATLAGLKEKGWEEAMENVSVMSQTRFDDVPITYVPYYLIFDHTGKLRFHHMAGPYHGGNGDQYQKEVEALLKEVASADAPKASPGRLTESRTWTNKDGKEMVAALLRVEGEKAKFLRADGKAFDYPLVQLSEEGRKEIEELIK